MMPDQFRHTPQPENHEAPGLPFKKIMVVRHGDYDSDDRMSDRGRAQMKNLGGIIRQIVKEEDLSVLILSSSAPRAADCAQVIAEATGVPFETHDILWSDGMHPQDFRRALELIDSKKGQADFLILLTHAEYSEGLPYRFGERLGKEWRIRRGGIDKGQAFLIDSQSKTIALLSSQPEPESEQGFDL